MNRISPSSGRARPEGIKIRTYAFTAIAVVGVWWAATTPLFGSRVRYSDPSLKYNAGDPLPAGDLHDDRDNSVNVVDVLDRNKGNLLIVSSTSCKPCMEELSQLRKYKGLDKFKLIVLSKDGASSRSVYQSAIKSPFTLLSDRDGQYVQETLHAMNSPISFIVDQRGKIVFDQSGLITSKRLGNRLHEALDRFAQGKLENGKVQF